MHDRIKASCALWLRDKGFRARDTEVYIAKGWIADVVGAGWLWEKGLRYLVGEDVDIEDFLGLPLVSIVEVKVSVGDYKKDVGRKFTDDETKLFGNLNFVAAPRKLLQKEQIPETWGLLEWVEVRGNPRGRIYLTKKPIPIKPEVSKLFFVFYELASSCHNRTYKEFRRELNRYLNQSMTEQRQRLTVDKVTSYILARFRGKEPWHNFSDNLVEKLEHGISWMRDNYLIQRYRKEEDPSQFDPFPYAWLMQREFEDENSSSRRS